MKTPGCDLITDVTSRTTGKIIKYITQLFKYHPQNRAAPKSIESSNNNYTETKKTTRRDKII